MIVRTGRRAALLFAGLALAIAAACAARARHARPDAAWTVERASGLRALSGADGVTTTAERGGARCLTTKDGANPGAAYLYFALTNRPAPAGPLYVTVEYYDEAPGAPLQLQYDSAAGTGLGAHYRPAEDQAGGWMLGSRKWRTAGFLLKQPRLAGSQNLGADFRLAGTRLFVRAVRLSAARPARWAEWQRVEAADVKPLVRIGPGGQLIVGGFDPAHPADAGPQSRALEAAVPALKQLGVTSHEGYVRWNLCEPQEGKFDWSVYDQFVAVYKRHGLKWVPFLICGSAYSLPDWYYKKPGSQGYVCLEHHQESDVQSLWNPTLRKHVARFIQAFCEHYRDTGVIESILLGVTGNYGECIYPASGNDWTADIHGPYHTHAGFWAGDPFAVKDFNRWLLHKYGSMDRFVDAWGPRFPKREDVKPFLRADAPNERAWLDMCEWYIGSMTDYARFWVQTTRRYFPKGDIYLCTGGHAPPEHGSDFGEQCRVAAEFGAGVRITNEGSDYRANFSLTRWVASAGQQYGAYYSFEPAGGVDANGVVVRIYNAAASGARGLHYYFPNLFGSEAARQNFVRYGHFFQQHKPVVEIAVYYPETWVRLTGKSVLPMLQPLRDRFDFDYMSDGQIRDGGLKRVKALVLVSGSVAEASTWRAIGAWVRQGGLLLTWDGMGALRTVEGDERQPAEQLGPGAAHGRGRIAAYAGADYPAYRDWLSRTLAAAPELSAGTRAMLNEGGKEDGLFATLVDPTTVLWLNTTDADAHRGSITVSAHGIAEEGGIAGAQPQGVK